MSALAVWPTVALAATVVVLLVAGIIGELLRRRDSKAIDKLEQLAVELAHQVAELRDMLAPDSCRVCGCTDAAACWPNGCYWVEPDLCSQCVDQADAAIEDALAGRSLEDRLADVEHRTVVTPGSSIRDAVDGVQARIQRHDRSDDRGEDGVVHVDLASEGPVVVIGGEGSIDDRPQIVGDLAHGQSVDPGAAAPNPNVPAASDLAPERG